MNVWYHKYMKEKWLPVKGYENRYEVSSLGRLRGPRGITNGSKNSHGYMQACLRDIGAKYGVSKNIHVLVAEAFLGERPSGHHVCHKDGDKANNRLSNLRYDTPKNNWEDFRNNPGRTNHSISRQRCPIGHSLIAPNLVSSQLSRGWRSCLACNRARGLIRLNKDKNYDMQMLANEYYERIMNEQYS